MTATPIDLADVSPDAPFISAVAKRLRELALGMHEDAKLSIDATVLGAALVQRLQELYKLLRVDNGDEDLHDLFKATAETIEDLNRSKKSGERCDLTAGDLLNLLGTSAERA